MSLSTLFQEIQCSCPPSQRNTSLLQVHDKHLESQDKFGDWLTKILPAGVKCVATRSDFNFDLDQDTPLTTEILNSILESILIVRSAKMGNLTELVIVAQEYDDTTIVVVMDIEDGESKFVRFSVSNKKNEEFDEPQTKELKNFLQQLKKLESPS